MRLRAAIILLSLATVYQILAVPLYRIEAAAPDFFLITVIYLAFFGSTLELLILAGGFSVLLDILSLNPLGTQAVGLFPAILIIQRTQGWFLLQSPALRWCVVLPVAVISYELRSAYIALMETGGGPGFSLNIAGAIYTAVLGIALHGLLDGYRNQLGWNRDRRFLGRR